MEGTCWMCFEKRHLHAALEGCDKYPVSKAIYPFHSKLASTRNWADSFTSINANDASMPRCQWISLWGRYATHSTKCSPSPSLSVTPSSSNTDNWHRCETKKEEENEDWKTGSSISGKKNNINMKKYKKKHKKKYNNNSNNGKHSNINL